MNTYTVLESYTGGDSDNAYYAENSDDYYGAHNDYLPSYEQEWTGSVDAYPGFGEPVIEQPGEPSYEDLGQFTGSDAYGYPANGHAFLNDNDHSSHEQGWMDNVDMSHSNEGIASDPNLYPVRAEYYENATVSQEFQQPEWCFSSQEHRGVASQRSRNQGGMRRAAPARNLPSYSTKRAAPVARTVQTTKKPNWSYTQMVAMAINSSDTGDMVVQEIYAFLTERFPYFRNAPAAWKNSVRHTLSLSGKFIKTEIVQGSVHGKKRCLWSINPDKKAKMDQDIHYKKSIQDYEQTQDFENQPAASTIASTSASVGRKYNQTPRDLAPRHNEFNFKPVPQRVIRPSPSAVLDPSDISLHDSRAAPRAPINLPAILRKRPSAYSSATAPRAKMAYQDDMMACEDGTYGQMRSPMRDVTAHNQFNGSAVCDPNDIDLF